MKCFTISIESIEAILVLRSRTVNGLDKDLFLDVARIRSIDGQRVLGLVGILEDNYWQQIQNALLIVCGFDIG